MQQSQIDLPLCDTCAPRIFNEINKEIAATDSKLSKYAKFLEQLNHQFYQRDNFSETIAAAKLEEAQLEKELEDLQKETEAIEDELAILEFEERIFKTTQESHWKDISDWHSHKKEVDDTLEGLDMRLEQDSAYLKMLMRSVALNDAFHIWVDGEFGTINGLKLGKLPNHESPWSEVNAALGCTLYLVHEIAKALKYTFSNAKLILNGSASSILNLKDGTECALYYEDGFIAGFLRRGSFNSALTMLLGCISELGLFITTKHGGFKLIYEYVFCIFTHSPHRIKDDKIDGKSIHPSKEWTKPGKALLVNLKAIIAWLTENEYCK